MPILEKDPFMNKTPQHPRIKSIYPAYRLDDVTFRIGAQLGITAEFDDPDGQLWALVTVLDGRPLTDAINSVQEQFPQLSPTDILDGIQLLEREGFIEEAYPEAESMIGARYQPNVNYFSRFAGLTGDRFTAQHKINEADILLLGLGGGGSGCRQSRCRAI